MAECRIKDEAFITLATNDVYCRGALVLAESLKKNRTMRQLVIMITPHVTEVARAALADVFDVVKHVDVLDSRDAAHLALLKRPELGITFTKIHCWTFTEYRKCVFMDADMLALQNIDELFDREELSAAPDSGWPDLFNSGLFVFRPSNKTFNDLLMLAAGEGSFDGGDQGLLNTFFHSWATADISRHLPFLYNLHVSASYTYLPAFAKFGKDTKVVHFLGPVKPWHHIYDRITGAVQQIAGPSQSGGARHFPEFLKEWWALYNDKIQKFFTKEHEMGTKSEGSGHHRHDTASGGGVSEGRTTEENAESTAVDSTHNHKEPQQEPPHEGTCQHTETPSYPWQNWEQPISFHRIQPYFPPPQSVELAKPEHISTPPPIPTPTPSIEISGNQEVADNEANASSEETQVSYDENIQDTATSVPDTASSVPDTALSVPDYVSSVPDYASSVPDNASSVPDNASSVPDNALSVTDASGFTDMPESIFSVIEGEPEELASTASGDGTLESLSSVNLTVSTYNENEEQEATMMSAESALNGVMLIPSAILTTESKENGACVAPKDPEQIRKEVIDHMREWERGNIDYMGRDSFSNIQAALDLFLK